MPSPPDTHRPLALVIVDAAQRVVFINPAYLALFPPVAAMPQVIGLPATDLLAVVATCFVDTTQMQTETLAAAAAQTAHFGRVLRTTDGRLLERDAAILPDGGWVVTYQDVTEEHRLRLELESIARIPAQNPNPIFRLAPDGTLLYANAATQALRASTSPADLEDGRRQMHELTRQALAAGVVLRQKPMVLGERTFDVDVVPFPAEGYVNFYLVESTARRVAEARQAEAAAALQVASQIPEQCPSPILRLHDQTGETLYANPAAYALRDRLPNAVLVEARAQMLLLGQVARAMGAPQQLDMALGEDFYHVHVVPVPVEGYINLYLTDITAEHRAQQVLERSEKRYRDLLQYSQALICTHTLDGTVLSVNPAIVELLGRPAETLIGRPLADAMPPEDRPGVADYLAQFAASPESTSTGVMRLLPANKKRPRYLLYQNVRVDEPGAEPYVIGYAQDITERIRAERAERDAREAAEAAAQARANFLANMSHEIRTPLNGILGLTQLLAQAGLPEQQQQWVELIRAAGHTLLHLLNDVLDMSKISSGRLDLLAVPFDLCATIRHAAEPIALRACEKELVFNNARMPATSMGVIGDPHRLTQILNNLLTNALKFTERGSITLEKRLVRLTDADVTFTILVHDTGIGIAPEAQEAIFEEFTQAYSDIAVRYGGTGLGLAICARLVNQMGGQLVLSSVPGVGTTFGFTLTLPRAAVPEIAAPTQTTVPTLQGRRVLLAEDNDLNRMLARLMLVGHGLDVTEASDGQQALEQVEQAAEPFEVVLMDIQMPRLNGLQATAAIRALPDPRRARVPILALTANAFRSDIEHYLAAGMDDYLTKPFEEADLLRVLTRLLGQGGEAAAETASAPRAAPAAEALPSADAPLLTAALRFTGGNRAAVGQLVATTLTNTPPLQAELARPTAEAARVAAVAHQLLPTARLFGADELAAMLEILQTLPADHPDWPDYRQYAAQLLADLLAALAELPALNLAVRTAD